MRRKAKKRESALFSDLLLLPDGRILVQDLTRPMARLLNSLNPKSDTIAPRAHSIGKPL
jgi:hypothetical protein